MVEAFLELLAPATDMYEATLESSVIGPSDCFRAMVRILLCGDVRGDVPKVCDFGIESCVASQIFSKGI